MYRVAHAGPGLVRFQRIELGGEASQEILQVTIVPCHAMPCHAMPSAFFVAVIDECPVANGDDADDILEHLRSLFCCSFLQSNGTISLCLA